MTTICLAGMHRSGTSLLARVVNLLGVHLGGPDQHLRANQANPTGYWEHRGIVRIDNELLAHLGGDWAGPPHLPPGWELDPDLDPLRADARAVLAELRQDAEVVGFKDPRASLLLPFWRTVTDLDHVLACSRPPRAVSRSLHRRNGLAEAHVAALTTRSLATLAADAPELHVVDYHELMAGSEELLTGLAARLGLPAPTAEVLAAIRSFIRPDLDHGEAPTAGDTPAGSTSASGSAPAASPELRLAEEVHTRFVALPTDRDWLVGLAGTLNEAAASDGRAPGRIGARATRLAVLDAEVAALETRAGDLQARVAELSGERDAVTAELTTLRRDHAALRRQHDRLRGRRSVRAALAVAAALRPVVRGVRALRRRIAERRGAGS